MSLWASKIGSGEVESPWTIVTFGFDASDCAALEVVLRVRARIWNELDRSASATYPPCLPVAPVIRSFFPVIVNL